MLPRTKVAYQIYVIELSKKVFTENSKFRLANPQYNGVLECLYVGMSSKSPNDRFDQHVNGVKSKKGIDISSSLVKKYGKYLRPSLYQHLPAVSSKKAAQILEQKLASDLKRARYAVWSN